MQKILVPVDFSDTSLSAFFFAEKLASKYNASIDVVHIYDGSINTNKGLTFELMQTKEDSLLNRLRNFVNIAPDEGGKAVIVKVECKTYLAYNTSAKLSKLSKDYDFIVMGMTGTHMIERKLIGSIASSVAQKADCPVVLVPRAYVFTGLRNIVYAQNWESVNDYAIRSTIDIGKTFQAALHFVHVNEILDIKDFTIIEQEALVELLEESAPEVAYHLANINNESAKKGLEEYAHDYQADLIVLVNRQHTFFDNLLKRSLTKEMALHSNVPLLIYHARK